MQPAPWTLPPPPKPPSAYGPRSITSSFASQPAAPPIRLPALPPPTATEAPPVIPPDKTQPKKGLSKAGKIGIGISVALVVIGVVIGVLFVTVFKRKKKNTNGDTPGANGGHLDPAQPAQHGSNRWTTACVGEAVVYKCYDANGESLPPSECATLPKPRVQANVCDKNNGARWEMMDPVSKKFGPPRVLTIHDCQRTIGKLQPKIECRKDDKQVADSECPAPKPAFSINCTRTGVASDTDPLVVQWGTSKTIAYHATQYVATVDHGTIPTLNLHLTTVQFQGFLLTDPLISVQQSSIPTPQGSNLANAWTPPVIGYTFTIDVYSTSGRNYNRFKIGDKIYKKQRSFAFGLFRNKYTGDLNVGLYEWDDNESAQGFSVSLGQMFENAAEDGSGVLFPPTTPKSTIIEEYERANHTITWVTEDDTGDASVATLHGAFKT